MSWILQRRVDPKYWLSPKACRGILRRADRRGKELPPALRAALERVAKIEKEEWRKVKREYRRMLTA